MEEAKKGRIDSIENPKTFREYVPHTLTHIRSMIAYNFVKAFTLHRTPTLLFDPLSSVSGCICHFAE